MPSVINRKITGAAKIAIISHVNPDGDAIGSSLAMYHFLNKPDNSVTVIMPDEYPDFLKWLPGSKEIVIFSKKRTAATAILQEADLIFILDFNTPARAGKASEILTGSKAYKILIDHHPDPDSFADLVFSDTVASSTAELVYRFIESAGQSDRIDEISATCIYTGIMSDTGSFSYNSSQPETYRILSELLKKGIDKDNIYYKVYDNFSESRLKLLGYCLDRKMVVLPEYRTAYMSLSLDEKKKYNYVRGDSEGFVNYPLSVKGIDFVAFFMENNDHVKISFRSKGRFDTNSFAGKNFDGGGHANASGGESKLSLSDTINKFVALLPLYMAGESSQE